MASLEVEADFERSALPPIDNPQATAPKSTDCDPEMKDDPQPQQITTFASDHTTHGQLDSMHPPSPEDIQLPSLPKPPLHERIGAAIKSNSKMFAGERKEPITREKAPFPVSLSINESKRYLVPWQLCETWNRMRPFLKDIFVGDSQAITEFEKGQYELLGKLQEDWPATVIIPDVWEDVILPGFLIDLHMPPLPLLKGLGLDPSSFSQPDMQPMDEDLTTQEGKTILYSISCYQHNRYYGSTSLLFRTCLNDPAEFTEHKRIRRSVLEEHKVIQCAEDSQPKQPTKNEGYKFLLQPDDTVTSISLRIHSSFLLNVLRAVVQFSSTISKGPGPPPMPHEMPPTSGEESGDNYETGIFQYPYKDIFCHKEEILKYKTDSKGLRAAHSDSYNEQCDRHIDVLMEYLDAQTIVPYSDFKLQWMKPTPTTTFAGIWLLLKPGKDVYIRKEGQLSAFVVDRLDGGVRYDLSHGGLMKVSPYVVHAWNLVFDGKTIGRRKTKNTIPYFDGERDMTSLPVFPAQFRDALDGSATRKSLIERGRKYFRYSQGPSFLEYSGPGLKPGWKMYKRTRVVVEHTSRPWTKPEFANPAWDMTHQDSQISQTPYPHQYALPYQPPGSSLGANLRVLQCECYQCVNSRAADGIYSIVKFSDYDGLDPKESCGLTEHQYYLLASHMYGFILKDRAYDILYIDGLEEPSIVKNAINCLVMDSTNNVRASQ